MNRFGIPEKAWNQGKEEAKEILKRTAKRRILISYSQLANEIRSIKIHFHGVEMQKLLAEIGSEEFEDDKGILTSVVVYKHGEHHPGPGFYELAENLGFIFEDKLKFWMDELKNVYEINA